MIVNDEIKLIDTLKNLGCNTLLQAQILLRIVRAGSGGITQTEICNHIGCSKPGVNKAAKVLFESGAIRADGRLPGQRTYEIYATRKTFNALLGDVGGNLNDRQIKILQHTLGDASCFRNWFVAGVDHADFQELMILAQLGYMRRTTETANPHVNCIFKATAKGKAAAWMPE